MSRLKLVVAKQLLVGVVLTAHHQALDGQPPQSSRKPALPVIGSVKNTKDFDGPGCSLWLLSDRTYSDGRRVFLSDFDRHAAVNLGGRDVGLNLVASSVPNGELKKGAISTSRYRGASTDDTVTYVVTGACAPTDESCEVVNYEAVVTVATTSVKRSVHTHGICGS